MEAEIKKESSETEALIVNADPDRYRELIDNRMKNLAALCNL